VTGDVTGDLLADGPAGAQLFGEEFRASRAMSQAGGPAMLD